MPDPPDPGTRELIEGLERRRLQPLVARNLEAARSLRATDYELIPPGGTPITGHDYLGLIERGEMVYDVFEAASDITVRPYGGGAVIRYLARISVHGDGWRDDGLFWHTDVYEWRNGRWQAVWSQATRAGS